MLRLKWRRIQRFAAMWVATSNRRIAWRWGSAALRIITHSALKQISLGVCISLRVWEDPVFNQNVQALLTGCLIESLCQSHSTNENRCSRPTKPIQKPLTCRRIEKPSHAIFHRDREVHPEHQSQILNQIDRQVTSDMT